MPFTPFHLGPGALFKTIGGDRFSFVIFGGSQVVMDVEPLARMIRGDAFLHGVSHTVVGAVVIGMISAAIGRPLGNAALRISGIGDGRIGWMVAAASALIGTFSHIGLDAVMHGDMNPVWPFAHGNGLLDIVSHAALHLFCAASAVAGASIIAFRALRDTGA